MKFNNHFFYFFILVSSLCRLIQELLKFKRQTSGKIKRVPTVKKELSSQIRLQSNDTNEDAVKGSVSQLLGKKLTASREKIDNDLVCSYSA